MISAKIVAGSDLPTPGFSADSILNQARAILFGSGNSPSSLLLEAPINHPDNPHGAEISALVESYLETALPHTRWLSVTASTVNDITRSLFECNLNRTIERYHDLISSRGIISIYSQLFIFNILCNHFPALKNQLKPLVPMLRIVSLAYLGLPNLPTSLQMETIIRKYIKPEVTPPAVFNQRVPAVIADWNRLFNILRNPNTSIEEAYG